LLSLKFLLFILEAKRILFLIEIKSSVLVYNRVSSDKVHQN